ncbi:MAG: hypothetical protein N2C12_16445 [Planctomycetales bacterium]
MAADFSEPELEAYLDEALHAERMTEIETALKSQSELAQQLVEINGKRDAGIHSIGEIWRRYRLTCPTREQLGSYLLGVMTEEQTEYIRFHLREIQCRICGANLDDLDAERKQKAGQVESRRRKYFQSSAGHLRGTH